MATTISRDDVLHLAELSNLILTDAEIDSMSKDLESILGYVAQLDELDTDGVEPTYQVIDLENVWREDKVVPHVADKDNLLAIAPDTENGQIKVPKVL
ncbi:Asp-tRNA(Asn)/Glu-tRNA(Gln) amidotransferase subunit GatC [Candidatus Saccharibacteria bacterium]|nr:Asp-tRNA(Asn)/Glu-tRNA(Gln) amidotransferase subunit GatC [Candidatus Saccharibacteria bacterium]